MENKRMILCEECGHAELSEIQTDCSKCHGSEITNYDISNPTNINRFLRALEQNPIYKTKLFIVKFLIVAGFLTKFLGYLITPLSLFLAYGSRWDIASVNLFIAVALILLGKELVRVAFKRVLPDE